MYFTALGLFMCLYSLSHTLFFQTKNNLIAHADLIELSLTELKNGTKVSNGSGNGNGNGENVTRLGKYFFLYMSYLLFFFLIVFNWI